MSKQHAEHQSGSQKEDVQEIDPRKIIMKFLLSFVPPVEHRNWYCSAIVLIAAGGTGLCITLLRASHALATIITASGTIFVIASIISYTWYSYKNKNKKENSIISEKSSSEAIYPDKLTVHVILPTNKNNFKDTLGDGLLQAAGFLAASDAFKDNINIVSHDHQNNADKAWKILEEILNKEAPLENPICVIFTMSSICQTVFKKCKEIIVKHPPSVKKRLSILFTVASAPDTPHDGDNFFQHFVAGDIETDVIVRYCQNSILINRSRDKQYIPKGLLFVMNSPYSKGTANKIKEEIENDIQFVRIELDSNDELTNDHNERIKRFIKETKIEERFSIIIAYDTALLRSIEALNHAKYEGTVIATTTLSVKDWQEYLENENHWDPNKTNVFYTRVKGFNPDDKRTMFAYFLNRWSFDEVIRQNREPMKFYNADYEKVKNDWFSELEKKVYKKIYPNYISAFCFDSVRLFSIMQKNKMQRLSELLNCSQLDQNENSPFSQNKLFDNRGKTDVPVEIHPLESNKVKP